MTLRHKNKATTNNCDILGANGINNTRSPLLPAYL